MEQVLQLQKLKLNWKSNGLNLAVKKERDRIKDEKYSTLIESKKEAVKLRKKQYALKEQEVQQRREIAENELKEKKKYMLEY